MFIKSGYFLIVCHIRCRQSHAIKWQRIWLHRHRIRVWRIHGGWAPRRGRSLGAPGWSRRAVTLLAGHPRLCYRDFHLLICWTQKAWKRSCHLSTGLQWWWRTWVELDWLWSACSIILTSCPASFAKLPPAQAEFRRQWAWGIKFQFNRSQFRDQFHPVLMVS